MEGRGWAHVRAPMVWRLPTALAMAAGAGGSTALPRNAEMPPDDSVFSISFTFAPPPTNRTAYTCANTLTAIAPPGVGIAVTCTQDTCTVHPDINYQAP